MFGFFVGFCDNDSVFRILCLSFRDLGLVFGIFLILLLAFSMWEWSGIFEVFALPATFYK